MNVKKKSVKLDTITRLACTFCKSSEQEGKPIPEYARGWWTKHKAWDVAREKEETATQKRQDTRRAARAKLTEEERRALGV